MTNKSRFMRQNHNKKGWVGWTILYVTDGLPQVIYFFKQSNNITYKTKYEDL